MKDSIYFSSIYLIIFNISLIQFFYFKSLAYSRIINNGKNVFLKNDVNQSMILQK